MDIHSQLFQGRLVCLAPIDHDKDAEIESRWTHDPDYLRAISMAPAFPLLPAQVRKKYEKIDKQVDENGNLFYFMIRARGDERLLGFTCIEWVSWTTGSAHFNIGIGNPQDRRRGYGSEALQMMLRYAFNELNLYRLSVFFSGDNQEALRFFQKHGFSEEARLRQALQRDGCFWDVLHLGLLSTEWQARPPTSETH